MPPDADEKLIDAATTGDAGALERLVEQIWPQAYRIAAAILRDRTLAEDVAQEACAAIVRALPRLRDPRTFASWTHRIVANHAITAARRNHNAVTLEAAQNLTIDTDNSDALDLHRELAILPLEQRAAVILHYFAGMNSTEIGQAVGIPAATVRFHLMLARRALRKALTPIGDTSACSLTTESHKA